MSSKAKIKGTRVENQIRDMHLDVGVKCERVPGSGMFGSSMDKKYTGDLRIPSVENTTFVCEVKARKNGAGFTTLENWMGTNDIMFLKRNHALPMVVLTWDTYIALMWSHAFRTWGIYITQEQIDAQMAADRALGEVPK